MYKDLSELFESIVSENETFNASLQIVKENSLDGRIWLIGGFVYRNLVNSLYGKSSLIKDIDFIIEKPKALIELPEGWKAEKNRLSNPKFIEVYSGFAIDFVPLEKVHGLLPQDYPPKIKDYLRLAPLNLGSLAYDTNAKILIGGEGILGIMQKIISVNNLEIALAQAKRNNTTINEIMMEKAKELGFEARLIKEK